MCEFLHMLPMLAAMMMHQHAALLVAAIKCAWGVLKQMVNEMWVVMCGRCLWM